MNSYKFDEIEIGHREEFYSQITKEDMEKFLQITGDTNPLHTDENYANAFGYEANVVYGMLTASYLSTLAGIYLPGKYSLINSLKISFVKPVYIGDKLKIQGTVLEKNDKFRFITIKVNIFNQENIKVLRGTMDIGVKK